VDLWGPLVIVNCAEFASAGNGLGLCISTQCVSSDAVAAPEGGFAGTFTIPGMGDFELDGEDRDGIVILAPEHSSMAGLTGEELGCWDNSVHQHIQSLPDDFDVLAIDDGRLCGDTPEGEVGVIGPVILARSRSRAPLGEPFSVGIRSATAELRSRECSGGIRFAVRQRSSPVDRSLHARRVALQNGFSFRMPGRRGLAKRASRRLRGFGTLWCKLKRSANSKT